MNKMNKKGFTLIEMLVVIAIIAVLVSIIVPVVGNSTNKASAATNAANLRSIAASVAIKYLDGTIDGETTTMDEAAVEALGINVPAAKSVKGIEGDTTCSYGTNGTIDAYANIAAGQNTNDSENG